VVQCIQLVHIGNRHTTVRVTYFTIYTYSLNKYQKKKSRSIRYSWETFKFLLESESLCRHGVAGWLSPARETVAASGTVCIIYIFFRLKNVCITTLMKFLSTPVLPTLLIHLITTHFYTNCTNVGEKNTKHKIIININKNKLHSFYYVRVLAQYQ